MSNLTPALALRAAINVLRDSAESRKMPNGEPLTEAVVHSISTRRTCSRNPCLIFVTTSKENDASY
jgi:hypothetical protein